MIPLILAEVNNNITYSTIYLFFGSLSVYVYLLYEVFTGKVAVQHKKITLVLFILSGLWIALQPINAIYLVIIPS